MKGNRKYRVFLIDDTPLIREALKKTIPWEELSCTVCGEAGDGLTAKAQAEKLKPDIIITDIRMPGMDGLELAEFVNQKLPFTRVIVITGFQEFEYAKRALKLNVQDLLLKPLDNQNVIQVLNETVQEIAQAEKRASYENQLMLENNLYRQQVIQSLRAVQGKILSDMLKGRNALADYREEELTEMGLRNLYIHVAAVRVRSADKKQIAEIQNRVVFSMYEYEKQRGVRVLDVTDGADMGFFVLDVKKGSSREHKVSMRNQLHHMNHRLREDGLPEIFAVIGEVTNQLEKAVECYRQAQAVLERNFFTAREMILDVGRQNLIDKEQAGYWNETLERLYAALESEEKEWTDQEIQRLLEGIAQSAKGDLFQIKCLLSEACITLLRHYSSKRKDFKINEIVSEINGLVDMESARIYMKNYLENLRGELKDGEKNYNPLTKDALEYIRKNYRQEISLTQMAEYLGANPSYLSRLLKQETGENFTEILNKFRIQKAKQLLGEPGLRITEVAQRAGYSNYEYFFQVFRKIEGISPSEYKKQIRK